MKQRFKIISAVHLFLIKDGKVLLLRRYNTGYRDGQFSVPAGHLDGNEKAKVALAREAQEEIGLSLNAVNIKLVHVMHRKSVDERIDLFFEVKRWKGNPTINEPEKSDHIEWFAFNKLPKNIIPYIRFAINQYRNRVFYSEFGWIVPDEK